MVAVLDYLGLDAVHVCGMSMGGFVAVELATAHPGRVKSLILGYQSGQEPAASRPTTSAADRHQEIDRLLALGARRVDIGQTGTESWTVLADPEGNEFCVIRPKETLIR
jgi:pimeloyl-ACP methyl ester carboxylesterase